MEAFQVSGIPPPFAEPNWMEDKRHLWFDVETLSRFCRTPSPNAIKQVIIEKHGSRHSPGIPLVTSRYRGLRRARVTRHQSHTRQLQEEARSAMALNSAQGNSRLSFFSLDFDKNAEYLAPASRNTLSRSQLNQESSKQLQRKTSRSGSEKRKEQRVVENEELTRKIDELTIEVKEKELFYKDDLRKVLREAEETEERLREEHREHIKAIEEDQKEELDKIREFHQRMADDMKRIAEDKEATLEKEVDRRTKSLKSLEDKFDQNVNSRLRQRETEVRLDMERIADEKLKELKNKLDQQKVLELDKQSADHRNQLTTVVNDHKREMDKLYRKFAASTVDAEKLKETVEEMKSLRKENDEMRNEMHLARDRIRKLDNELADVKVKLIGYQEHFAEKVAEVDDKYVLRIHGLMAENTDLRKAYVRKCDELFNLQSTMEKKQGQMISSAKDAMKAVIEVRNRTQMDLTGIEKSDNIEQKHPLRVKHLMESRPRSAPSVESRLSSDDKALQLHFNESQEEVQLKVPRQASLDIVSDKGSSHNRRGIKSAGPVRKNHMGDASGKNYSVEDPH